MNDFIKIFLLRKLYYFRMILSKRSHGTFQDSMLSSGHGKGLYTVYTGLPCMQIGDLNKCRELEFICWRRCEKGWNFIPNARKTLNFIRNKTTCEIQHHHPNSITVTQKYKQKCKLNSQVWHFYRTKSKTVMIRAPLEKHGDNRFSQ